MRVAKLGSDETLTSARRQLEQLTLQLERVCAKILVACLLVMFVETQTVPSRRVVWSTA